MCLARINRLDFMMSYVFFQFPIQPNTTEGRDLTLIQDLTELLRMGQKLRPLVNMYFASWYQLPCLLVQLESCPTNTNVSGKHLQAFNTLNINAGPGNCNENLKKQEWKDKGSGNVGTCQRYGERGLVNQKIGKNEDKRKQNWQQ